MARPRRPAEPAPPPARREQGQGSVTWVEGRRRWRARLPKDLQRTPAETYHRLRDEAEAWLARELNRDPLSFDPARPLGEYLNHWFRLRSPAWGEQTARRYRYEAAALRNISTVPLYRLRGEQVQAAQAALLARKLTRRYVYNVVSLLRRALEDAVKWRIIAENPVDTVTLPAPEHTTAKAWSLEEVRAVLAAVVGHRFEACYLLILWGGLRIGEVVSLRWSQIADDGTVAFDQAEHSHLPGRPLGRTKRDRDRETQLPAHVVTRLRELRADGPAPMDWPARPKRDVAYVYVAQRPDGNRWTARVIRDDWSKLVAGVKIGDQPVTRLTPHGGRRSFGTMHMVSGTPLADLSRLMGHANPAVTAASYLGTSMGRRQAAAEQLAALISPPSEGPKGQEEGQGAG